MALTITKTVPVYDGVDYVDGYDLWDEIRAAAYARVKKGSR